MSAQTSPLSLTVRVLRGDPITNRGKFPLPSYEVLFTLKRGAKAEFPPYGVCKPWEDFKVLHDSLHDLDIGAKRTYTIEAPFPPASEDREVLRDPSKISETDIAQRLTLLTDWTHALLEIIGELELPLQNKVISLLFKFLSLESQAQAQAQAPGGEVNLKSAAGRVQPEDALAAAARECLRAGYHNTAKQARGQKYQRKVKKEVGLKRFEKERVEIDTFEQRWDQTTGQYYLFNPYTGECITDMTTADRSVSTWMLPDPHLLVRIADGALAFTQTLYGQWYASRHRKRTWEKGCYAKDPTRHKSGLVLTALARGFLVRRSLRIIHRERYHRCYDEHNKCCYFLDTWTQGSSWYKPLLAHPLSILPPPPDVRDDRQPFDAGPLYKKIFGKATSKISSAKKEEDEDEALTTEEAQERTAREPEVIDLNEDFLRVTMWMDEKFCKLSKMAGLWEAFQANNWTALFRYQLTYCEDSLVQQFCFHAFARMQVPIDKESGGARCEQIVRKVFSYMLACVQVFAHTKKFGCNAFLALAYALLNIFQNHPSRVAFFYGFPSRTACMARLLFVRNTSDLSLSIDEIDDLIAEDLDDLTLDQMEEFDRDLGAKEHRIEQRMQVFCSALKHIPVEITLEQHEKGIKGEVTEVARPTPRASEMVKVLLQIIGVLAHEREPRESIAFKCGQTVVQTMRTCIEEPYVIQYGLRCLYNFMYMAFEGWRYVHMECDVVNVLQEVKMSPVAGDEVVLRDLRRVELSIETDGWRGKVEQAIAKEMAQTDISVYIAKHAGATPEASPSKTTSASNPDGEKEHEGPAIAGGEGKSKRKGRNKDRDKDRDKDGAAKKSSEAESSALLQVEL